MTIQTESAATIEIGVVISGAGARGAYEAGLLAHMIPEIAARTADEGLMARFSFLGTSAGSLNAALIGSRAPLLTPSHSAAEVRSTWESVMTEVTTVWSRISEPMVMDYVSPRRFLGVTSRAYHLLSRLDRPHVPLRAAIDVDPLVRMAQDADIVGWDRLAQKVDSGVIGAVGAATTARDGRTVLFWHRHAAAEEIPRDERRDIDYVDVELGPEHVLASSAIPACFPAVHLHDPPEWEGWYYDGGVRLNTPLKPAIKLGLKHLLVVGTHPIDRDRGEPVPDVSPGPEADEALLPVVNQVMTDQIIQDLYTLRRRNAVPGLPPERQIRHVYAGPPDDSTLARLAEHPSRRSAARWLRGALYGPARWELSSYLLFDPGYLSASVEQGRKDAAAILPSTGGPVDWALV